PLVDNDDALGVMGYIDRSVASRGIGSGITVGGRIERRDGSARFDLARHSILHLGPGTPERAIGRKGGLLDQGGTLGPLLEQISILFPDDLVQRDLVRHLVAP